MLSIPPDQPNDSNTRINLIHFYRQQKFISNLFPIINILFQSVMNNPLTRNYLHSPYHCNYTPNPLLAFHCHQTHNHQPPLSVSHSKIKQLPSCANHKRKKATFIMQSAEGQKLSFCQKCALTAQNQGFRAQKIEEFYGSKNQKLYTSNFHLKQRKERTENLNSFLEQIKSLDQRIGHFGQKISEITNNVVHSNSNQVLGLFQRLEDELLTLKNHYLKKISEHSHRAQKTHQQFSLKIQWNQEDLEHMIDRVCKNYDRLLSQERQDYGLNLNLLQNSFNEKHLNFLQIEREFQQWFDNFKKETVNLNFCFINKLSKVDHCLNLDCDISGIQSLAMEDQQNNEQFQKIIQEMSTTHTLD